MELIKDTKPSSKLTAFKETNICLIERKYWLAKHETERGNDEEGTI
jgi:hypothetical protein